MWTRRPCGPRAHAGSAQTPRQTRGPPRHSGGPPLVLCLPPAPRGAAGTHCASTAPWGDLALLPLLVPEVWPTASPTSRGSLVCLGTLPAGPCAQAGDPPELVRVGDVSRVGLSPVMRTQRPRARRRAGIGATWPRGFGEGRRRPGSWERPRADPRSRGGSPWPTPGPGLAPPQLYKDKFLLLKLPSVARGRGSPGKLAGLMNVLSMFPLTHTPPWTT